MCLLWLQLVFLYVRLSVCLFISLSLCVCVCVSRLVLIVESVYQSVKDVSSAVLIWLSEKYSSWKLRRERSSSASAQPQLSENITLPSTGQSTVSLWAGCLMYCTRLELSSHVKRCVHKLSKLQKVDLRKSPLKLWTCKRLKFN